MEYIDFNPCNVVKTPKLADTTRKHTIIYPDLFQTILDHIEQQERKVAMMLGYYAGLRVGEVLGLSWDNVDFNI